MSLTVVHGKSGGSEAVRMLLLSSVEHEGEWMELHATLWGSGQERAALLFPECLRAVPGVGCSVVWADGIGVSCVPH